VNVEIELDFEELPLSEFQTRLETIIGKVQCMFKQINLASLRFELVVGLAMRDSGAMASVMSSDSISGLPQKASPPSAGLPQNFAQFTIQEHVPNSHDPNASAGGVGPGAIGMERKQNRQVGNPAACGMFGAGEYFARQADNSSGLQFHSSYGQQFASPPALTPTDSHPNFGNLSRTPINSVDVSAQLSFNGDTMTNKGGSVWGLPYGSQMGITRASPAFDHQPISGFGAVGSVSPSRMGASLDLTLNCIFGSTGIDCLNTPQV